MNKTDQFLQQLQTALRRLLPEDWVEEKGGQFRVMKNYPWGYGGITPAMSTGHLPAARAYLSYGVFHHSLDPLLRQIEKGWGFDRFGQDNYHARQTTDNHAIGGETAVVIADYRHAPFADVARKLIGPSPAVVLSFFERFSNPLEIRRALETKDTILMSLGGSDKIIAIDAAANDFEHLRKYRAGLSKISEGRICDKSMSYLGIAL